MILWLTILEKQQPATDTGFAETAGRMSSYDTTVRGRARNAGNII
jgi:hypothetical protein